MPDNDFLIRLGVDSAYLYKEIQNDTLKFIYKAGEYVLYDTLSKHINNGPLSLQWGYKGKCLFVAEKTFIINDRELTVSKYYYEEDKVNEEEFYFFYHTDYGLLLSRSVNFGKGIMTFIMKNNNVSPMLIDSIIGDSAFFDCWYDSPLPSPPYLIY